MQEPRSFQFHTSREEPRERRARTFHRSARAYAVSVMLLLACVLFAGFVVLGVLMFARADRSMGVLSLACLGGFGVARLLAFVWSRGLACPLCHGTILAEKRCHKHSDAVKLPLLSHKASVVLGILFTLGFRCMYCGTAYRLWKR